MVNLVDCMPVMGPMIAIPQEATSVFSKTVAAFPWSALPTMLTNKISRHRICLELQAVVATGAGLAVLVAARLEIAFKEAIAVEAEILEASVADREIFWWDNKAA